MDFNPSRPNDERLLPNDLVDEKYDGEDDFSDYAEEDADELSCSSAHPEKESNITEGSNQVLNHSYRNYLRELRRVIVSEIQRCKEKREAIEARIKELEKEPVKIISRKNWYHLFGYPYFKDKNFFPCPINSDQREKLAKHEIDYHKLPKIRRWVESDCLQLEEAVKADAISQKASGLLEERGTLLSKLRNQSMSKIKASKLKEEIEIINKRIEAIKAMDPKILYGEINKPFDWLKITAEGFGELRSSEEVQAMWVLCRHPSINRRHWTKTENENLRDIALRHREQDWAKIALELNTNRSEFQCVIQYQRKVNTEFINHKWTAEEDEMLKFLVQRCAVKDYIPWSTIAMCMRSRTRQQVYNRWTYSINPTIKKGKFTVEEDCLILAGVKHFGEDFPRISELLPGRTTAQVYARYKMCLSRDGPLGQWTVEEDKMLLKLAEKHGKKWHKIAAEHFTARSRSQIRHRYLYLEEWLSKNPDCSVSKAPRRDLGDLQKRNSNLWTTIQNALTCSTKPRKGTKEIDREDMEFLRRTMARIPKPKRTGNGRKRKRFTYADSLLNEIGKVSYSVHGGRSKVVYTQEEAEKRKAFIMKILQAFQANLAFPFDESLIKNDETLNVSDKSILLELKMKYDEAGSSETQSHSDVDDSSVATSSGTGNPPCSNSVNATNGNTSEETQNESWLPLYAPGKDIPSPLPEIFPSFITNLIGFRTTLLARSNLKMWKGVKKTDVIAQPAWRPTSKEFADHGMKCFTKEESSRLFSDRLFSLFMWPTFMARMEPDLEQSAFTMTSPAPSQPAKRVRKRTIKDQSRKKSRDMRKRWQMLREENIELKSKAKRAKLQ